MTLFTAEGLIRAYIDLADRSVGDEIASPPPVCPSCLFALAEDAGTVVHPRLTRRPAMDGWLIGVQDLWSQRAPGNTCLIALQASEVVGELARNDSKGCGTVMRTAPVGVLTRADYRFELGMQLSALTHGHINASLSAGFLSVLIGQLIDSANLGAAVDTAKRELSVRPDNLEVLRAIETAEELAGVGDRTAIATGRLGAGWIAEEALAISLHAVLVASDLEEAVVLAVNHPGDSDSTGAIAGNIAGALYGRAAIPDRSLRSLELRTEIIDIATDLAGLRGETMSPMAEALRASYPCS